MCIRDSHRPAPLWVTVFRPLRVSMASVSFAMPWVYSHSATQRMPCLLYTSILLDECGFDWDKAFDICQKVFSYTNHTVMAEALEKWNVDIFKMTLPRIYQIVVEMDRRARAELEKVFPGDK